MKAIFCRDSNTRSGCPRGIKCPFLHFDEDMDRYRVEQTTSAITNGNFSYMSTLPPMSMPPPPLGEGLPMHLFQRIPPPPLPHISLIERYHIVPRIHSMPSMQRLSLSIDIPLPNQPSEPQKENIPPRNYNSGLMPNQQQMGINQSNTLMQVPDMSYYGHYPNLLVSEEVPTMLQYRQNHLNHLFEAPNSASSLTNYQQEQATQQATQQPVSNVFPSMQQDPNAFSFDDPGLPTDLLPDFCGPPGFPPMPIRRRVDSWPTTSNFDYNQIAEGLPQLSGPPETNFDYNQIAEALPQLPGPPETPYNFNLMLNALPVIVGPSENVRADDISETNMAGDRRAVGADRFYTMHNDLVSDPDKSDSTEDAYENELKEELKALEKRIDSEFKSAD